jgi:hypothetical protein
MHYAFIKLKNEPDPEKQVHFKIKNETEPENKRFFLRTRSKQQWNMPWFN